MSEELRVELGKHIRNWMIERRATLRDLAKATGLPVDVLSRLERGIRMDQEEDYGIPLTHLEKFVVEKSHWIKIDPDGGNLPVESGSYFVNTEKSGTMVLWFSASFKQWVYAEDCPYCVSYNVTDFIPLPAPPEEGE